MTARTVPTMPSFLAGQKLTATLLNQIGTYVTFWTSPPKFRMHQSISQNVPNTTWTQLTCDTPDYDSDSGRGSSTPWSYTIPVGMTGRWTFGWHLPWVANATGNRACNLYRNGAAVSNYPIVPAANGTATANGWSDSVAVNAGDVMGLYGWQSSGGALGTFVAADQVPTFWGRFDSLASP